MPESVKNEAYQPMMFDAIKIGLASPDKIREWSHGEVTKPETIKGLGMPLRQIQKNPLQGRCLRPLRCGSDQGKRAQRADGAY